MFACCMHVTCMWHVNSMPTDLLEDDSMPVELPGRVGRALNLGGYDKAKRSQLSHLPQQRHKSVAVVDVQLAIVMTQFHQTPSSLKTEKQKNKQSGKQTNKLATWDKSNNNKQKKKSKGGQDRTCDFRVGSIACLPQRFRGSADGGEHISGPAVELFPLIVLQLLLHLVGLVLKSFEA